MNSVPSIRSKIDLTWKDKFSQIPIGCHSDLIIKYLDAQGNDTNVVFLHVLSK